MTLPIIDMRSRPALLHDFYGATPGSPGEATARWLNRRVGSHEIDHFTRSRTLPGYLAEIRSAGIHHAVVIGRDTPGLRTPNDEIAGLVAGHHELIGIGSVDPIAQGAAAATEDATRAIRQLGLKGINLEPGFGQPAAAFDDARLFPVYEVCAALDVPVFLMAGPTTPDLAHTHPAPIARVARAFPTLPIVCHHGAWPYVDEMLAVAFRHENVFVVSDMYTFLPGGERFITAANGFLRDQFLFGTSYPFRAMGQTVEDFLRLGLHEDAIAPVFHRNARRVLRLPPTA